MAIGLVVAFLSSFLEVEGYSWLSAAIIYLALCALLVDIGWLIKNKHVRRKYIIYVSVIIGQIVTMLIISEITGVPTVNTWLGTIGANAIFATIFIMLFDTSKSLRETNKKASNIINAIVIISVATVFFVNISLLVNRIMA